MNAKIQGMNDVQEKIAELTSKGWTLAALADEMGVSWVTASRWRSGEQYPENGKAVVLALGTLSTRKPPKRRRYAPGEHHTQRKSQQAED